MDLVSILFRWLHVASGILWIGLLYWFNFVNIPLGSALDGDTRKKVIPELAPRTLFFFRWGAMYTWITGLALLGIVFYHGGLMFDEGKGGWNAASIIMVILSLGMFGPYDQLAKSNLGKNNRVFGVVSFIIIAIIMYLMIEVVEFSYRAYVIHIGAMFGTIMAANVWMRIWPAQRKIIPAIKEGTAPDAALAAQAGQRSRHNTYLSVPLVYAMLDMHSVVPGADSPLYMLGVILLGWLLVALVYKKSGTVKGI
jgi:uncharacterized membrane protein